MNRSILSQVPKLISSQSSLNPVRLISTSAICLKSSSGKYKSTVKKDKPLTYEMSNPPHQIAHRKSWNSWNCSSLQDGLRPNQTITEDMFIRKFITGTFHNQVSSEVIIKRQFNHIRIAFILRRSIAPQKVYFLLGYSEEMLANWLQCPVTIEVQTIAKQEDVIFKYV